MLRQVSMAILPPQQMNERTEVAENELASRIAALRA